MDKRGLFSACSGLTPVIRICYTGSHGACPEDLPLGMPHGEVPYREDFRETFSNLPIWGSLAIGAMALFQAEELYVTNIPGNATDAEMIDLITSTSGGKVREYVIVSKRREAGVTQAALVRMEGHEAAVRAKRSLHRGEFKGKMLQVRWSNTARVLWVSHLHESVTNEVSLPTFSHCC